MPPDHPSMPALTATYTITIPTTSSSSSTPSSSDSPSNNDSKTFTHPLSLPSSSDNQNATEKKTAHLSALRVAVKDLQGELNEFLTAKMEEDKATAAVAASAVTDGSGAKESKVRRTVAETEEEEERRIERGDEEVEEEGEERG